MFFTSQISEVILPHTVFCVFEKNVCWSSGGWKCVNWHTIPFIHRLTHLNLVFSSGQSKKRRTHTQTQSFSQWKTMTVLLGNTGERKYSGLWSPAPCPQRAFAFFFFFFFTHKPLPCSAPPPRQLSAQTCSVSLCLGWSSAFFFLTFAADETLTRKRQMTTSEYCKVPHIWTPATAKHKNFGLGTGTSFMLFPPVGLYVCVYACVRRHFVVSFWKAGILHVSKDLWV